jgi:ABC-type sugar transport system ATPase subunit
MPDETYLLEMNNISKSFPGVRALVDVSFHLRRGEVFAIVGENGAGKSTLIKILSGVYTNDSGEIRMNGTPVQFRGPKDAIDAGINTIYQETSLVQDISVAENIFLGRQPMLRGRRIDWKSMFESAQQILNDLSIHLSPSTLVADLSAAQQQLVEIAKAFSRDAKIIIMDEPTASITEEDTENLFSIIRGIVKTGTAVIYISHRLKEIFQIADRVKVLRDGVTVTTVDVGETSEKEIVKHMVGREIGNLFGEKSYQARDRVILEVRDLSKRGVFDNISFELREGEILGMSGLVGAGRSEIVRALYGLDDFNGGEIILEGKKLTVRSTADVIKQGIAFVSEDRRLESIIQGFTVKANITILLLKQVLNRLRLIKTKSENELAARYVQEFDIKTPSLEQLALNLSGGNQQKVALAKCLSTNPKILILDEPTKGIDVGAKKEIHTLIKELANRGVSIILVSSELPEIIGMCHRVVVVREGRLMKIFEKDEITEEILIHAAVGSIV